MSLLGNNKVNFNVAWTHVRANTKQTLVTALGVTIGVAVYLFMNSLDAGFSEFSRDNIFQNSAHIKVFKSEVVCKPLNKNDEALTLISNPQIYTNSSKIINPKKIIEDLKGEGFVTDAIGQVDFPVFYNKGSAQVEGTGHGVNILEYNQMFNTERLMIAGSLKKLEGSLDGIILGSGIAEKLSLRVGSKVSLTSAQKVTKVLRVVGIYKSGNKSIDDSKSYVNVATAQQFLKEGSAYVSAIYANIIDPDRSEIIVEDLKRLTNCDVEDWKTTNADIISQDKTRQALMGAMSLSILIMAAFGIYNILSATISQKINDIAILKATGFNGRDVIVIFVLEAAMMGILGTAIGLIVGAGLIEIMSKVYVGGAIQYFPIAFESELFIRSAALGFFLTLCAGYFPAKKAANIDPIKIFRK